MTDPYGAPAGDSDQTEDPQAPVERGRALLIAAMLPTIVNAVVLAVKSPLMDTVIRTALIVPLFYFLYRGRIWARNVFVAIWGIGIVGTLVLTDFAVLTAEAWQAEMWQPWFIYRVGLLVVNSASVGLLFTSSAIRDFMRFQRSSR